VRQHVHKESERNTGSLKAIGSALMLGGSFITQGNAGKGKRKASAPLTPATSIPTVPSQEELVPKPIFQPRVFSGHIFGLGAAMCYGTSPLMARQAFLHASEISTAAGGCLAYTAATLFLLLILLKPGSWADIKSMKRENLPWFLSSAVLVAISQAFVYASLAVARLMVVTPILQLSLVFRLFLSQLINRDHEVMNTALRLQKLIIGMAPCIVTYAPRRGGNGATNSFPIPEGV
jgi:uncharacterized membrane protein